MNEALKYFLDIQRVSHRMQDSKWFEDEHTKNYIRAGAMVSYSPTRESVLAITMANMISKEQRKGHLTFFYMDLLSCALQFGYTEIRVENAHAPAMQAWCLKNGFVRKESRGQYDQEPCFYQSLVVKHRVVQRGQDA